MYTTWFSNCFFICPWVLFWVWGFLLLFFVFFNFLLLFWLLINTNHPWNKISSWAHLCTCARFSCNIDSSKWNGQVKGSLILTDAECPITFLKGFINLSSRHLWGSMHATPTSSLTLISIIFSNTAAQQPVPHTTSIPQCWLSMVSPGPVSGRLGEKQERLWDAFREQIKLSKVTSPTEAKNLLYPAPTELNQ